MKKSNQDIENKIQNSYETDLEPSFEVSVYNEMLDQTSQQINVVQMIENQFKLLNKAAAKKNFLLGEISNYLK
jgi:hypothetical protein